MVPTFFIPALAAYFLLALVGLIDKILQTVIVSTISSGSSFDCV